MGRLKKEIEEHYFQGREEERRVRLASNKLGDALP